MTIMVLIRTFLCVVMLVCGSAAPAAAQSDVLSNIQQRLQKFQDRYGIPLIYKDIHFSSDQLHYTPASGQEYLALNTYLDLFEQEINKYPPDFFRKREIRAVALVTRLFSGEKAAEGMYSPEARVMFFDFLRFADNKALKKHSIHHEIFHMMALQTPGYQREDPQWNVFNPEGFSYGEQKKPITDVNPYNPQAPNELGFVTYYAMASIEEDKAEIFACLMQEAHRKLINRWAQKDDLMRQKIQAIKDFTATYCPEMNEAYWSQ